jgi:hypothetical protein
VDGVDATENMTLATLNIMPGSWRTNENSTDVRACPVEDACVGGTNTTEYCREGHEGPYCNLCKGGYSKDVFGLCQECKVSTKDVAVSIVTTILGLIGGVVAYVLWNRFSKRNKKGAKKITGGVKILFVTYQILAGLPTIIPAIQLPDNFKGMLSWLQFFNLNLFQFVSVGCYTGGFNFYSMLFATTITPGLVIFLLLAAARGVGERNNGESKKGCVSAALALSYLILPTVTTAIFQAFPCDNFDDGTSYLRADYSISCDSGMYGLMVWYAVIMLVLFPVGILSVYSKILINNKNAIKEGVEEREDNIELMSKGFLFENYKASCWWYEIVDTVRRLMLTSVLGLVEPGTYSQLAAGLVMSLFGFGMSCKFEPYIQIRDNLLAILSAVQIFVVMLVAMLMKSQKAMAVEGEGANFDGKYLGYVLMGLNCILVVVFVLSGVVAQCVKRSRRERREGGGEERESERAGTSLYDIFSGLRASLGRNNDKPLAIDDGQEGGLELGEIYGGGKQVDGARLRENPMQDGGFDETAKNAVVNPALVDRLRATSGAKKMSGGGRGVDTRQLSDADIPPPPPPLPAVAVKGVGAAKDRWIKQLD